MLNEFPILNFEPHIYWRAVVNCNVKYADVSAGDMAEIWTDKRGYLGTFKIAQVRRNIEQAKIVFEGTKAWDALYGNQPTPVPAENQTGTLKIVQKNALRPTFERYYDEYITPMFTSIYTSVAVNQMQDAARPELTGKTEFRMPQGIAWPQNIAAEILSSTGKYSGTHMPVSGSQWAGMTGYTYILVDVPFNGDDSGVLVYKNLPYSGPPIGDRPYVDTTQEVPTIVNPTSEPIVVTSTTDSGKTYTQTVAAGESQPIAAPVEKTPDPVFVAPPVAPSVKTDDDYKRLIAVEMVAVTGKSSVHDQIKASYLTSPFGYTQYIANVAVSNLKQSGSIPMDWKGVGLTGHKDWILANYPLDYYVGIGQTSTTKPVATTTTENQLKSATIMTDEQAKALIATEMQRIMADPVFIKLIQDNYKNSLMGYTQSIATNAVKELKERGVIAMDWKGEGIWGQADWIRANYPRDEYVVPTTSVNPGANTQPVTTNPGATTTNPPVTTTNTGTSGSGGGSGSGSGSGSGTGTNAGTGSVIPELKIETPWYKNPMVQAVLAAVGIFILVKIFNKK